MSWADERLLSACIYCGSATASKDHVPSRALIDAPYPLHFPTVPACSKCNNGFSADEQYLACLIDCVQAGSTDPSVVRRTMVKRTLAKRPALGAQLKLARWNDENGSGFSAELGRVRNVAVKLGQGHAAYELSEPQLGEPTHQGIAPLLSLTPEHRHAFETIGASSIWPEVGSRAFQRAVEDWAGEPGESWIVVQPGRYRYAAYLADGVVVKVVLSEYLAIEVRWEV